ncbi:MAG: NUDIX hydrolase [Candidatus Aenigmarchaeota archaeon]|nr:NUDIX hydrolase [Candidatus Aenigmarchaeota archaeon]
MKIYKASEALIRTGFLDEEAEFTPVAAAYVNRNNGILNVRRLKEDDPLRYGHLTLPEGQREYGAGFLSTAIRETKEETDVDTMPGDCGKFLYFNDNIIFKQRDNIGVFLEPNGDIWARYLDSGKSYVANLRHLTANDYSLPRYVDPESGDPKFTNAEYIFTEGWKDFSPFNQILLELIEGIDYKHINGNGIIRKGDVLIENIPLRHLLKVKPPLNAPEGFKEL